MSCLRRPLAFVALAALATTAAAQVQFNPRGGIDDAGSKIAPIVPGYAVCFGDGTGMPCPADNHGALGHGCENSLKRGGGVLWAEGEARVSQDSISLHVQFLPRGTTALFLQSTHCRNKELGLPFGDGLMCMSGSVLRLGAGRIGADTSYVFPSYEGYASISMLGQLPLRGGERYYQVLYRDMDPFSTRSKFNLTNAWSIEWAP